MHSICDTVLITSDEIPRDLLRDRKIIRFRVIIRFGLTPHCHNMLQEVHNQVVVQLIQDGMHKDIARLQQSNTLDKSDLDLVKQLAVKTAQCDELRKENVDLKNNKKNNVSHPITPPYQQHQEPIRCEPTKDTLVVGSSIIRHLNERDMAGTTVKSISGVLIKDIIKKCDKSADIYREVLLYW